MTRYVATHRLSREQLARNEMNAMLAHALRNIRTRQSHTRLIIIGFTLWGAAIGAALGVVL